MENLLLRVLNGGPLLVLHVSLLAGTQKWETLMIRHLWRKVLSLWVVESWNWLIVIPSWAELLMERELALLLCCLLSAKLLLELSLSSPVSLELGIN